MKILFIHNFYQQFGGEDSVALAERRLLEDHGEEVCFWTKHNDEIKKYGPLQKANFFKETIRSSRTVREIQETVAKFQPDVAFVHNIYPLISPSLYPALKDLGVPIVQVLHDFRPFCSNGWFYINGQVCERCKLGNHLPGIIHRCYHDSFVLSTLYSTTLGLNRWAGMLDKIDAFICLTAFFEQKILEAGIPEEKIFIRPNFINAPPLPSESRNGNGNYALYLGRLSNEKGIWTLLRAFAQLPEVPLKIAGTGPLENELREYAATHKLSNVEFLGFKSGEKKWELVRNSEFGVIPSEWYENFPIVALEFFAAARPVVASRIGGLPHVVEEGKTGTLFEPGNADDLARRVKSLRSNPAEIEVMGRQGRLMAEGQYGPQASYNNLMNIFHEVLSR
jgi:glycosyltransferase involved in cell wall biosynthesis